MKWQEKLIRRRESGNGNSSGGVGGGEMGRGSRAPLQPPSSRLPNSQLPH